MGAGVAGDPSGRLVLPPLSVTLDLSRTLSQQSFKDSRGRVTRRSVGVPSLSLHPSRERGKLRGPGRGSPDGHSQGHCRDGTAGPETARTIEVPPPVKRPGGRDRAPDGPGRRPRPEASGAPGLALPRFRGACACTRVWAGGSWLTLPSHWFLQFFQESWAKVEGGKGGQTLVGLATTPSARLPAWSGPDPDPDQPPGSCGSRVASTCRVCLGCGVGGNGQLAPPAPTSKLGSSSRTDDESNCTKPLNFLISRARSSSRQAPP